ncbi:MAG: hypothetical protein WAO98_04355 [Alphaproteobacteria bacterium]
MLQTYNPQHADQHIREMWAFAAEFVCDTAPDDLKALAQAAHQSIRDAHWLLREVPGATPEAKWANAVPEGFVSRALQQAAYDLFADDHYSRAIRLEAIAAYAGFFKGPKPAPG